MLVLAKTPLGYKVIVENQYEGMLFDNEIFEKIAVGDRKVGYVKTARKDGKLDMSLQPIGQKAKLSIAEERVVAKLKEAGGTMPFGYKSDAEEIQRVFGVSKKGFKRTLTHLIEEGTIVLDESGIRLVS